jgi:hypothetical protein
MKNPIIAISSSYIVITTIIVYALLATTFFEIDNALGEGENFVVDNNNSKTTNDTKQVIETQCKSPCPPTAEMCVEMCA